MNRLRSSWQTVSALLKDKQYGVLFAGNEIYDLASFLLLVLAAVGMPALSFGYGAFWDERMSIEYSEAMWKYFNTFGADKTCLDTTLPIYNHLIYYGNLFGLISTLVGKVSPFDLVYTRHYLNALMGFGTVYFTFRLAKITRGSKAALLALALLLLMPRFFGHVMNDFRDTGFMLGYVASIYYMVRLLETLPAFDWKACLKVSVAIFFACGIRIGGMILFAILAALMFFHWVRSSYGKKAGRNFMRYALIGTGIFITTYILTVAFWPWAQQDPLVRPFQALLEFSQIRLIISQQHYMGEMVPNFNVPWTYLFVWMGITLPLAVLLGLVLHPVFVFRYYKLHSFRAAEFAIYFAVLLPLTLYLIQVKNYYDSWRHFLFLAPLIALLATWGWRDFVTTLKKTRVQWASICLIAVLLFLPLRFMWANHPFQTVYFNELIGGVKGAAGKFELDIDANAARYGMEWLNDYTETKGINHVLVGTNNDPLAISAFAREGLIAKHVMWLAHGGMFHTPWDYAIVTPRTLSPHQLTAGYWPFKETIHTIKVDGYPVVAVMERQNSSIVEGMRLMNDHRIAEALNSFQHAVSFDPENEEALRLMGMACYELDLFDLADSLLNRCIEVFPESTFAYYYKARITYEKKDYLATEKLVEMALKFRADNPAVEQLLANLRIHQGRIDEAEQIFIDLTKRTNVRNIEMAGICNDLSNIYIMKAQQSSVNRVMYLNKSIELLVKAVSLNPDLLVAYKNLIAIYYSMNRPDMARQFEVAFEERLNRMAEVKPQ